MDTLTLPEILRQSAASHEFKAAVRALEAGDLDHAQRRIAFGPGEPPSKVLYAVLHVLESHPDLLIESAHVDGYVRPTEYSGEIILQPDTVRFSFVWDPKWKAQQLGWMAPDGQPHHGRAARELGHQCFRFFARVP
ncbi:hypothetical protein AMJ85_08740 [candidate division BRC1 bacterium SM23_51]|nr:MAG: hypothetical protein AMJ85_08740 [candidate division BRC1 bacterium SM23_51]